MKKAKDKKHTLLPRHLIQEDYLQPVDADFHGYATLLEWINLDYVEQTPNEAILAEATPNSEMTLIADVNLDLLKQARSQGAARNLAHRRLDLYRLEWI